MTLFIVWNERDLRVSSAICLWVVWREWVITATCLYSKWWVIKHFRQRKCLKPRCLINKDGHMHTPTSPIEYPRRKSLSSVIPPLEACKHIVDLLRRQTTVRSKSALICAIARYLSNWFQGYHSGVFYYWSIFIGVYGNPYIGWAKRAIGKFTR